MAQVRRYGFDRELDFEQILLEAQHRWLRPPEICEILGNYKKFNIAPEPPNMPPSGSLFLFDRKVLRYFRKDGYNWRKKKDGKTVKEAHERLKAGSVNVLHCYYAHGEDNENFQRRCYWMLEENLSHIVLVHYREVKGYRTNFNHFKEAEEAIPNHPEIEQNVCNFEMENSMNSSLQHNRYQMLSRKIDSKSLSSALASDYEDAEYDSYPRKLNPTRSLEENDDKSLKASQKHLDSLGWEEALESHSARVQTESAKLPVCRMEPDSLGPISKHGNELVKQLLADASYEHHKHHVQCPQMWQEFVEDDMHFGSVRKRADTKMVCKDEKSDTESNLTCEKRSIHFSAARCQLDSSFKDEGLNKNDSFSQWMSKELGDVEPVVQSCSDADWDAVDNECNRPNVSSQDELNDSDFYSHDTSLSMNQVFRIIDFSPSWAYAGTRAKVLIAGKFLKPQESTVKGQLSCMFGETEVLAEIIADGVLRCETPLHGVGRVPFYVTCSDRLPCSQVKEFEYRGKYVYNLDTTSLGNRCEALQIRFGRLLSLGSRSYLPCNLGDSSSSCKDDNEWSQMLKLTSKEDSSLGELKERLVERLLKEKLCEWLHCKRGQGGNELSVLDMDGQGVLHFAAALGYDWAIYSTIVTGVNVNFRDAHGWTALHWAASCGREHTVVHLISLGASAGALTDPTAAYPAGRTAADLASENGHKGIAGYLAESALSAHLVSLTMKIRNRENNAADHPSGMTPILTASERSAVPVRNGDHIDQLALKDSLAAVCNATQAAARIHQVYRMQSFRRKQMRDCLDEKIGSTDGHAHSVVTMKTHKQGQLSEPLHAAAVRIQNKFRTWKGRKEFLTIRQQIVNIQAHVRGYQLRKHYKKIVWSVGILEKVVLRWKRKRSGLRGFKSQSLIAESSVACTASKQDDYDFLTEGRKQAEESLQNALSRVKSMVRYPDARDQYRRLLTIVPEIKELKGKQSEAIDGSETATSMNDNLIDVHTLLNDDSLIPLDC